MDKRDDARVGVRSTARAFGDDSRGTLAAFAGAQTLLLAAAGYLSGCGA
jgi:4-hydroxybenzoate polyprenyltransferase